MKKISLAMITLVTLGACATEPTMPPLPADFDPNAELGSDGKTDVLTKWYTEFVGELPLNEAVTGTTTATAPLHGRTITLEQGDSIAIKAEGDYWGFVAVYRKKVNGKWGKPLTWDYIGWNSALNQYTNKFTVDIPKSGEYLVVAGSFWSSSYNYSLSATCMDGPCDRGYCVTYQRTDEGETTPSNYYAINVETYQEGKDLLAALPSFSNEDIQLGSCEEQSTVCAKIYLPVCSGTLTPDSVTYGNLCELQIVVRQNAGATSAAKAHWDNGVCPATGCGGWLGDTCSADQYCAYQPGQYCGAADASSTCETKPQFCTEQYTPVCGCDGNTYSNTCDAASAGTGVMKNGPCDVAVVGDWEGEGAEWDVQFKLNSDGTFTKTELIAPCPTDAVCVWPGIVTNTGTYTYDSFSDNLFLTFNTANNYDDKVTFPSTLKVSWTLGSTTLVESLSTGGTTTYSPI